MVDSLIAQIKKMMNCFHKRFGIFQSIINSNEKDTES